jgi:hypothetical protein
MNSHRLKPLSIFFSAYRVFSKEHLSATLASSTYQEVSDKIYRYDSRSSNTLGDVAAYYFAEKLLSLEKNAKQQGYETGWNEDAEVKRISYYLRRLGYDWEMKAVRYQNNQYEIILKKNGANFHVGQASSGEREIINFILGIFALNITNGIIFIEEPELHLHPKWQKILVEILLEIAVNTNNQFILSTHSPSFITSQSLPHLFRVYKDNDTSRVQVVKDVEDLRMKDMLHIIHSTNNEKIFFCDAVILVEGITDVMVFQRILESELKNRNTPLVIEVIDIGGKSNFPKYETFIQALKIPGFYIADFDNLKQLGSGQIKQLFVADRERIAEEIKKIGSKDGDAILTEMEKAIDNKSFKELQELLDYVRSIRIKLKPTLTTNEQAEISKFMVEIAQTRNVYILTDGEIEAYFPEGFRGKDFEKVIKLLSDEEFAKWQSASGYLRLSKLINEILDRLGIEKK